MSSQQMDYSVTSQSVGSPLVMGNEVFNSRVGKRLPLQFEVSLKRSLNSPGFVKRVKTLNASKFGLAVISDYKLEEGAELQIAAFNNRFTGTVKVCHVHRCPHTGSFIIGLSLIVKRGKWVVI